MNRIIAKRVLREFWEIYPDSEQYLKTWYETAMHSDWSTPQDVKKTYASASIIKDNRVVFNIRGNSYRLVVKFNYRKQWGFVRFIGTHDDYNKIDAGTI
jgi:mRNA interferase HigB